MAKNKSNANQQKQKQHNMDNNNSASASSSLPPKKDKHIAKRFKQGLTPAATATVQNTATVTEFDISDIRATYGPKTPSATGPPTQIILPSNPPSSSQEKGKTRQELQNDLPDQQNVVNDQIMEDVHVDDQHTSDEQRTTPPIEEAHVEPIPILSDFVIVAQNPPLKENVPLTKKNMSDIFSNWWKALYIPRIVRMIRINLSAPIFVWKPMLLRHLKWIRLLSSYRKTKNIPIRSLSNGLNLSRPKLNKKLMIVNVILSKS